METLPTGVNAIGFATGWMVHHGKTIIRILRFLKDPQSLLNRFADEGSMPDPRDLPPPPPPHHHLHARHEGVSQSQHEGLFVRRLMRILVAAP